MILDCIQGIMNAMLWRFWILFYSSNEYQFCFSREINLDSNSKFCLLSCSSDFTSVLTPFTGLLAICPLDAWFRNQRFEQSLYTEFGTLWLFPFLDFSPHFLGNVVSLNSSTWVPRPERTQVFCWQFSYLTWGRRRPVLGLEALKNKSLPHASPIFPELVPSQFLQVIVFVLCPKILGAVCGQLGQISA